MPTISIFYGILIQMFWTDHAPPHFHAIYNEFKAIININTLQIIGGTMPRHALKLITEWSKRTSKRITGELGIMPTEASTAQNKSSRVTYCVPWDVVKVIPLPKYCLEVEFIDGLKGKVDLFKFIMKNDAGVFTVLRDLNLFNQVYIKLGAVTWPGELDLAPDAMYEDIKKTGKCVPL